ncbi:MAG: hypothetical protein ACRD12_04490 [Acidimicrobiales bacterium]
MLDLSRPRRNEQLGVWPFPEQADLPDQGLRVDVHRQRVITAHHRYAWRNCHERTEGRCRSLPDPCAGDHPGYPDRGSDETLDGVIVYNHCRRGNDTEPGPERRGQNPTRQGHSMWQLPQGGEGAEIEKGPQVRATASFVLVLVDDNHRDDRRLQTGDGDGIPGPAK